MRNFCLYTQKSSRTLWFLREYLLELLQEFPLEFTQMSLVWVPPVVSTGIPAGVQPWIEIPQWTLSWFYPRNPLEIPLEDPSRLFTAVIVSFVFWKSFMYSFSHIGNHQLFHKDPTSDLSWIRPRHKLIRLFCLVYLIWTGQKVLHICTRNWNTSEVGVTQTR